MTSSYANRTCSWKSLGSPKGDFLFGYANKALQILSAGRSVVFQPENPVGGTETADYPTLGFFSGGTSGVPELVTHNQQTIGCAVSGLVDRIGSASLDFVCCLPLWHVGGWMQVERAWATQAQIVFCDYRDLSKKENRDILFGKWISLVPTQLHELIKSKHAVDCLKLAKGIFVGGACMSFHLVQRCRSLVLPICPCYGSSETAGMVTLLGSDLFLDGVDGVGEALSHASIQLDKDTGRVKVQASSLCLRRGSQDFQTNSWLTMPDLGYINSTNSLVITGRSDRVINSGGEKIQPEWLESILYKSGLVEQCLVYGEPDERWGESVTALICPTSTNLEDLKRYTKSKIPDYMYPKVWKIMDALPLTEMGKRKRNESGKST
jgi:O-succinylbenzoic acid--CoA ligase